MNCAWCGELLGETVVAHRFGTYCSQYCLDQELRDALSLEELNPNDNEEIY